MTLPDANTLRGWRKIIVAVLAMLVLCFIAVWWLFDGMKSSGLWKLWFWAFGLNVAQYTAGNVIKGKVDNGKPDSP